MHGWTGPAIISIDMYFFYKKEQYGIFSRTIVSSPVLRRLVEVVECDTGWNLLGLLQFGNTEMPLPQSVVSHLVNVQRTVLICSVDIQIPLSFVHCIYSLAMVCHRPSNSMPSFSKTGKEPFHPAVGSEANQAAHCQQRLTQLEVSRLFLATTHPRTHMA